MSIVTFGDPFLSDEKVCDGRQYRNSRSRFPQIQQRKLDGTRLYPTIMNEGYDVCMRQQHQSTQDTLSDVYKLVVSIGCNSSTTFTTRFGFRLHAR